MNTLVNLEIAKLLKEKGFDLPCNNYTSQRDGDYFSNEKQVISYKNYNEITSTYSRPTIAEVIMWLYEKHNIFITTDIISVNQVIKFYASYHIIKNGFIQLFTQLEGNFNSPTEAYSQAIIYTLKNLI